MTNPIVVAVSEGEQAQPAIDLGVMAARLLDAPLVLAGVVVTITPGGATVVPGWTPVSNRTMLRDHVARELQARADAVPDDVQCTIRVTQALAALHGLETLVEEEDAQLLVIGASHLGPLARAARGDVGRGAIRHAGCAVLIAPDGPERSFAAPPARIAIGWDGSVEADAALDLAETLGTRTGAEVDVVRAAIGADPAELLIHASERCDLLVIGARRPAGLAGLLARSVSGAVLHDARCPVLVVPHGARVPAPA